MGSLPVGISGSRSAAILGLSKYATRLEVFQAIMEQRKPGWNAEHGYIFEPFAGNASTRFGHAFESAVIELTEQATSEKITDREGEYSLVCDVPTTCHIDGRFSESRIYEGKTVYIRGFDKSWGEPGTDRIPAEYQCQGQHNMMTSGADECAVSVLVFPRSPEEWEDEGWVVSPPLEPNDEYLLTGPTKGGFTAPRYWARTLSDMGFFHTYHIQAKPETHKLMLEIYDEFWRKHVLEEIPPECTDYEDVKRMFREPKGELILPEAMIEKCSEYESIGREIGSGGYLKKRQTELKTEIVGYLRKQTTVESDDAQEKVYCLDNNGNRVGSFDEKGVFRA